MKSNIGLILIGIILLVIINGLWSMSDWQYWVLHALNGGNIGLKWESNK